MTRKKKYRDGAATEGVEIYVGAPNHVLSLDMVYHIDIYTYVGDYTLRPLPLGPYHFGPFGPFSKRHFGPSSRYFVPCEKDTSAPSNRHLGPS